MIDKPKMKKIYAEFPYKDIADFKIQLKRDALSQKEILGHFIKSYGKGDELIKQFIVEYKKIKGTYTATDERIDASTARKISERKARYTLVEEEIDSIFDIIAKENPEI